jgi:hypothetical protein
MHDYGDDELYTKMYDLLIKIKGDEKEWKKRKSRAI